MAEWQPRAEVLALADSTAFRKLQCSLNAFGHSDADDQDEDVLQSLQAAAQTSLNIVIGMTGSQIATSVPSALPDTLQLIKQELDLDVISNELWTKLKPLVSRLTAWRQAVLLTGDCCRSDADAPQMSRPVRLFVDQKYVVDAFDSTDIVSQFLQFLQPDSKLNAAVKTSVPGHISLARQDCINICSYA